MDEPANFVWGSKGAFNQYSMTFTATGTSADLAIQSLETGTSGPYLTNVRVIEIPPAITTILNNDSTLSYDAGDRQILSYGLGKCWLDFSS